MRRLVPFAALSLLAAPIAVQAAMTVPVDQSRRIILGGSAANVVVGNPAIADVNIIDGRNLMVVGKRFGTTNLVVLDVRGRTLFDSEIVVSAGSGSVVSIYRGGQPSDYACTPYCQKVTGDPGLQAPPAAQQPYAPAAQPAPVAP